MFRTGSIMFVIFACLAFIETTNSMKHYRVTSLLTNSFLEEDPTHSSGYTGFVVDLLDELAKKINFSYEFVFPADKKYGSLNLQTNKWNGMMATLLNGDSDMIVADLTETVKRREVVDFTTPYLITGIGIMYNPISNTDLPFKNIEELVDQTEVKYGVIRHSSTHALIQQGRNETFVKMSQYFQDHPDSLADSLMEGVERVITNKGQYAFIGEAVSYHILKKQKYPELILVGDTFFPRQFGIVFPKGSSDKNIFDTVVFELRENGVLDTIAKKWNLV